MDAGLTGKPPESQTHVTFETAAEHVTGGGGTTPV